MDAWHAWACRCFGRRGFVVFGVTGCMTRGTLSTFTTWLARFTRLAWLTRFVGFLCCWLVRGVLRRCVSCVSRSAVVSLFCSTFFTGGAVATFTAVAAIAVT